MFLRLNCFNKHIKQLPVNIVYRYKILYYVIICILYIGLSSKIVLISIVIWCIIHRYINIVCKNDDGNKHETGMSRMFCLFYTVLGFNNSIELSKISENNR